MPAIPPALLKSTFYLYRSREEALSGANYGGTGFFVGIQSRAIPWLFHLVAVTNWHVAVRDGFSVIRINKKDGDVDVMEFDPSEWVFLPKWHDIAAIPVVGINDIHDIAAAISPMFLSEEQSREEDVGPGDDVFMVGRFMDHDGGRINAPAVRFGHISMSPTLIKQPTGATTLESYVIDVHSRTGYSGSPVFVYRTIAGNLNNLFTSTDKDFKKPKIVQFLFLLGIMWGYFPELWEITSKAEFKRSNSRRLPMGNYVEGMSGMSIVIPMWAISELLKERKIQDVIDNEEQKARDKAPVARQPDYSG
jgi:hypothetical protein